MLFGNLAEAVAEGRGKAQAASLRATRTDTMARRLDGDGGESQVPGTGLAVGDPGDLLLVAGDTVAAAVLDRSPDRTVLHRGRVVADGLELTPA